MNEINLYRTHVKLLFTDILDPKTGVMDNALSHPEKECLIQTSVLLVIDSDALSYIPDETGRQISRIRVSDANIEQAR